MSERRQPNREEYFAGHGLHGDLPLPNWMLYSDEIIPLHYRSPEACPAQQASTTEN